MTNHRNSIKLSIAIIACLAILYPLWERFRTIGWSMDGSLIYNLFPTFGMIAFILLWLHSMVALFEGWLGKYFDLKYFINITSSIILISIIAHPLLLLISIDFKFKSLLSSEYAIYIKFGVIAWLLLITYDIGKALKRFDFFVRHWKKILLISMIGFGFAFFHSLFLGSDLQSGPLRILWIFYGATGILSTIYVYGIRFFIDKRSVNKH